MIRGLATVALLACAAATAAAERAADLRTAILALQEQAIAAGMPDTRGAEIWQGRWLDDPESHYRQGTLRELHLRLRDGRWLLKGIYLHAPAPVSTLLVPGAHIVTDSELRRWSDLAKQRLDHANDRNPLLYEAGLLAPINLLLPQVLCSPDTLDSPLDEDADCFHLATAQPPPAPIRIATSTAWRHRLIRQLLDITCHADTATGAASCLDAALALMTTAERSERSGAITSLRLLGPWRPAYDLALAERLERWIGELYLGEFRTSADDEGRGDHPPVRLQDASALVALLEDPRPSRCIGYGCWPQTLGDRSALALEWLWGISPAAIAGIAAADRFSAEQRHATAAAAGALWRAGGERSLLAGMLADPAMVHLLWTTAVLTTIPAAERSRAAEAVVKAWSGMSAGERDALPIDGFEEALSALGEDPRIDALVRSWPPSGRLARSLALWHEHRGDGAPLTAHLAALLELLRHAPGNDLTPILGANLVDTQDLMAVMRVTALHPTQERLEFLLAALGAGIDTPLPAFVAGNVCSSSAGYRWGPESPIFDHLFNGGSEAMLWAIAHVALADRRDLPGGKRVCDAAAASLWRSIHADLPALPEEFPLLDSQERRDQLLAEARRGLDALLPPRLAAAGLVMPGLPVGSANFPDWWQRELAGARADGRAVALLITSTKSCPPCERLAREVLATPAWQAWAGTHVRMVVYDFATIPDDDRASVDRINELHRWYPMRGTPSFFLIDGDGRLLGDRLAFEAIGPEGYIRLFSERLAARGAAP